MPRKMTVRIGDLLLQKGLINSEQLQRAVSIQRTQHKDKHLGQILLELGYIDKEQLYFILAIQSGYPYIYICNYSVESEVLSLIPEQIAKKYQLFPLDVIQGIITIAMVNPLDKNAIEEVKKITHKEPKIFLTTPEELKEIYSRYYREEEKQE